MALDSKRSSMRKKVSFAFQVISAVRDGAELTGLEKHAFQGLEIGAGGMGFETGAPLRRGDQLSVRFELPGEKHQLHLTLQILHVADLAGKPKVVRAGGERGAKAKTQFRVGAKFHRMAPVDFTYLNNYIGGTLVLY